MRFLKLLFVAGLFFTTEAQVDTTAKHFWMMTYFQNASDANGAYLAFSSDSNGINWQSYNNAQVIIVPNTVAGATDHKMRDPMMSYDSLSNKFTLVWTVSWTGTTIGLDTSSDLKKWGPQLGLQVGATIPNCYVCWAPEIFWDDIAGQWEIIWSTCQGSSGDKHIYYTHINGPISSMDTTGTRGYSAPVMMFNPGFTVIDADVMKVAAAKYLMVFKDERVSSGSLTAKNIHYVLSSQPTGPWAGPRLLGSDSVMSLACTTTGTEGPSIVKQGTEYHLFFDPYSASTTYRMVKVTNLDTTGTPWRDAGTLKAGTSNFTYSHSNIIEVPRRFVLSLLYNKALPTPPGAPALASPANGATGIATAPELVWNSVTGVTGYNMQVSTSSNFAAVAQSRGVTSDSTPLLNLNAGIKYYWRINASTAAAGAGAWSSVWSFMTGTTSLPRSKQTTPARTDFSVSNNVLAYSVKAAGLVEISFKDILGRTTTILSREQAAGHYTIGLRSLNLAAGRYVVNYKAAGVQTSAVVMIAK